VGVVTLVEVAMRGDAVVDVVVGVAGVDVAALEATGAKKAPWDDDRDASRAVVEDDDAEVDAEPSRTRCGYSCARTRRMSRA
jgi:hypothetical protein